MKANKILKNSRLFVLILTLWFLNGCGEPQQPKKPAENYYGITIKKSGKKIEEKSRLRRSAKSDVSDNPDTPEQKTEMAGEVSDYEEGDANFQVKVKNWNTKQEKPKVNDDSDNVIIEKKDLSEENQNIGVPLDSEMTKSVDSSSLAAKIAIKNKIISWQPKWQYHGIGGPRLPDQQLSPDGSILAVVETTGETNGPYGSRLILINTYNWEIARLHTYNDKLISKICFIPGSHVIACWSKKQISLKQPYQLLLINCRSGKITSSSDKIKDPLASFCADNNGNKLYVKTEGDNYLYLFDAKDLSSLPQRVKSRNITGALSVSPDNSRIALAGNKLIEIFHPESGRPISTAKLPQDFTGQAMTFCGKNKYYSVTSSTGKNRFFKEKNSRETTNGCSNILLYNGTDNVLGIGKKKNSEIVFYDVPSLNIVANVVPTKIKPNTRSEVRFVDYLPHHNKYLAIDANGNYYVLYKIGRRWRKNIVISAKK